ncbi:MAG: hypothetical protein KGL42_13640 [Betaproteobacteria bacterium]|nr:hypothetical protein [Betaproteobacteria bacterium]
MTDAVLANIVEDGECRRVFAVCKGRPVKNQADASEQVVIVCVRASEQEAKELAHEFETAHNYVMFLEYLSCMVQKDGGKAALAEVNNAANFREFASKYKFNDEDAPRMYTVQRIQIVEKMPAADDDKTTSDK